MLSRVKTYFAGAKQEFKSIHWPNVSETRALTLVVIGMSLATAIYLGVFDYIFTYILGFVLNYI